MSDRQTYGNWSEIISQEQYDEEERVYRENCEELEDRIALAIAYEEEADARYLESY